MENTSLSAGWHDLYGMLGTSSAALIGLLFVATSLHLSEFVKDEVYQRRALSTTLILVSTLIQSVIILTPQPITVMGFELLVTNLWGLGIPVHLLFKAAQIKRSRHRGGFSARRAAFSINGYVAGIIGSVALVARAEWGVYLVTLCCVNCVVFSIWNAWVITLGVGRGERRSHR
jgi:predicted MFS family arabinose efflux permease